MAASPSSNPFVLPGLGQTGEMASNPLFASLEMMRQTFASLSGASGLTGGLSMQPTLDPVELEKKINELKSVESWLKLNLSMLSSTIQGMEVQLATITTLRQFVASNNLAAQQFANSASPLAAEKSAASSSAQSESDAWVLKSAQAENNADKPSDTAQIDPKSAPDAAQAWWNMLAQQFGQIAAATTASMQAANTVAQSSGRKGAETGVSAQSKSPSAKPGSSKTSGKSGLESAAARGSSAKKSTTRHPSKKSDT